MAEFASKGVAGSGLGLGIAGTALGVLNGGLGNILGGMRAQPAPTPVPEHNHSGVSDGLAAMALAIGGLAASSSHTCSEEKTVNRYEATQNARIAELETEVKLRDANIYTDGKLLDLYKYVDGKLEGVNGRLCEQAVWNATQTATIGCMANQIAALNGLCKLVIPNTSVCPGWGNVTVTPSTTTTT